MILVVEDNKALRILIKKGLEREGFTIKTAPDGKKGLSAVKEEHPDLIISDVIMPEMDGLELLKKVRKKDPLIPFILLTIKSEIEDYTKGYDLGATDYISKPFEMKTLVKKVNKRLKSSQLIREFITQKKDTLSLDKVGIIELLNMLKGSKVDCIIHISSSSGTGSFRIKNGKIKDSRFEDLKGKKAISRITTLKEGKISIKIKG